MDLEKKIETPFLCEVCSVVCTMSCAKCKNVSYCSKEHQKAHWASHKGNCFPVKMMQDDTRGRHLVATREILQGEIILKESPLISGPSFQAMQNNRIVCICCFRIIVSDFTCFQCRWPVCDAGCEMSESHKRLECSVLAKNFATPPDCYNMHYRTVFILRGLLMKEEHPEKWEKLVQLESHIEKREKSGESFESVIHFIHSDCGLMDRFTEDEVKLVSGILNTNAMASDDGPFDDALGLPRFGSYVYYNSSMISHGCVPNTIRIIQPNSEIFLRATVPIQSGQLITTAYLDVLRGTRERQKHFSRHYFFHCTCPRCVDPTELGIHFSSIKCPTGCTKAGKKNVGYILPMNPCSLETEWKCNNRKCCAKYSSDVVEKIILEVETDIQLVPCEDSVECIQQLEDVLESTCKRLLHPNHHLTNNVQYDLLQRIDYVLSASLVTEPKMRISLTRRELELTTSCLDISNVLVPGFSRSRGRLIYFLQMTKMRFLLFQIEINKILNNPSIKSDLLREYDELIKLRKEGHDILCYEPKTRDEGYLAASMHNDDRSLLAMKDYFGLTPTFPTR